MTDFKNINRYINELHKDIYPQPQDDRHTAWAKEAIDAFLEEIEKPSIVLDVGCGEGFCYEIFKNNGIRDYTGICIGEDFKVAREKKIYVLDCDFSFLSFHDKTFDFVFSRHALEHSPMPLLTLMEWKRVSSKYIALVLPAPEYWGYGGRNHYYVLNQEQWKNLFSAAKLEVKYEYELFTDMTVEQTGELSKIEYWYLLEKKNED